MHKALRRWQVLISVRIGFTKHNRNAQYAYKSHDYYGSPTADYDIILAAGARAHSHATPLNVQDQ